MSPSTMSFFLERHCCEMLCSQQLSFLNCTKYDHCEVGTLCLSITLMIDIIFLSHTHCPPKDNEMASLG
jgi:hypothetical protein